MTQSDFKHLDTYTCLVKYEGNIIFTSTKRGVAPLLDFYHQENFEKKDYTVIDKIMGKSAVLLAILIGAKYIKTPTISEPALNLARHFKIQADYVQVVPFIINRDKTGPCPIESSVLDIKDIDIGYQRIIQKLKTLSLQSKDNTKD